MLIMGDANMANGKGRPAEIADEDVIAAGNKLLEAGRRVTGFALRKIVEGGDASRLKKVWEKHLNQNVVVDAEPVQELPIEVQQTLDEIIEGFLAQFKAVAIGLNAKCVETSEKRVAEVIKTAKEEQDKAEAELVDAATTVDDLEAQLDAANTANRKLTVQLEQSTTKSNKQIHSIAELEKQVALLKQQSAALNSQLALEKEEAERRLTETNRMAAQINDLMNDKSSLAEQMSKATVEVEQLRTATEKWTKEKIALTKTASQLAASEAALKLATENNQSLNLRLDQLQTELVSRVHPDNTAALVVETSK